MTIQTDKNTDISDKWRRACWKLNLKSCQLPPPSLVLWVSPDTSDKPGNVQIFSFRKSSIFKHIIAALHLPKSNKFTTERFQISVDWKRHRLLKCCDMSLLQKTTSSFNIYIYITFRVRQPFCHCETISLTKPQNSIHKRLNIDPSTNSLWMARVGSP